MSAICGANCEECPIYKSKKCLGCSETNGCPFGKKCWIAKYIEIGGMEKFKEFKEEIITEFNSLNIKGLPKVKDLNIVNGSYVNLEYTLPNGTKVKYLNDDEAYLGNQLEYDHNRCFGILANMSFLLVCTYEENGTKPELILYKKR